MSNNDFHNEQELARAWLLTVAPCYGSGSQIVGQQKVKSFTFWNKLQEKNYFYTIFYFFLDVPVNVRICSVIKLMFQHFLWY